MVDVLLVTHNSRALLERCLVSVFAHTPAELFSLLVIDNASGDDTPQFLSECRSRYSSQHFSTYRTDENLGFCRAANLAASKTSAERIVFLDDDCEVSSNWLEQLLSHLSDTTIGLVSPKLMYPNGMIFSAGFYSQAMHCIGRGELDLGQHSVVRECEAMPGPCWLLRREIFERIGGFDEQFYPCQFEDIDYCIRLTNAGLTIICDGRATAIHHHCQRVGGALVKNRERFFAKWAEHFSLQSQQLPLDIHSYIRHGLAALERGDGLQASRFLMQAKEIVPSLVSPYLLGRSYEYSGRIEEACHEYRTALALYHPDSWIDRREQFTHLKKFLNTHSEFAKEKYRGD